MIVAVAVVALAAAAAVVEGAVVDIVMGLEARNADRIMVHIMGQVIHVVLLVMKNLRFQMPL
jgi:hypothetical protein